MATKPTGGLCQNTAHYDEIYEKFVKGEKGFDINRYCGDAIFKSKAEYQLQYGARQFKQSLTRMVAKIKKNGTAPAPAPSPAPAATTPAAGTPAPAPAPTSATPNDAAHKAPPKAPTSAGRPKTPVTPATLGGIPFGGEYEELCTNDEYLLELPHHVWQWTDSLENDRLSLVVYLPAGITKADISPRIVQSGNQVEIEMLWPGAMTNPKLPMFAGTRGVEFYAVGHVKVVSFRANVQRIKGGAESNAVYSVFRCDLPMTVEEQFSDVDVPADLAIIKYKVESQAGEAPQDGVALVCEMMCQRSNYKDDIDIEEFTVDFDSMNI